MTRRPWSRPWRSIALALAVAAAAAWACRGSTGAEGELTDEVTADAGSGSDMIQPTCVDDRLPDHDGIDDGQTCAGTDTGVTCTLVSGCPHYCVQCSDGTSSCAPCP